MCVKALVEHSADVRMKTHFLHYPISATLRHPTSYAATSHFLRCPVQFLHRFLIHVSPSRVHTLPDLWPYYVYRSNWPSQSILFRARSVTSGRKSTHPVISKSSPQYCKTSKSTSIKNVHRSQN